MPVLPRGAVAKLIALRLLLSGAPQLDEQNEAVDLREQLTDKQLEFWESWDKPDGQRGLSPTVQALLCGRRAGKSTLLAFWLVDGAIKAPRGSYCVYVSITREHAEEAMWAQIVDAATLTGVPFTKREGRWIRFAGGGKLLLAGCDTKREINKFRSKKIYRVAVDECGALRASLLQYLEDDVLEPACMDLGGQRVYSGTPGPFPLGWWFETTRTRKEGERGEVPVWRWNATQNPHVYRGRGGAAAYFAETRARKNWHETHPTFVREYLGEWYMDIGELVFPVEVGRNTIDTLPTHTPAGAWLDPARWRFSIGVDLGYVHASAFVVVAAHPGLAERTFVVESSKHVGWLTPQIRDKLRALRKKYPTSVVVADTGGYGKPIVEALRGLWGMAVEAADKRDKAGQIRLCRDAVLAGTVQVLDGEQNDALRSECRVMGWDPEDKTQPNPLAEDHAIDAWLYATRRLRHYTQKDAPAPLTKAEQLELERARKFKALEKRNRRLAEEGASICGKVMMWWSKGRTLVKSTKGPWVASGWSASRSARPISQPRAA